jgi:predicted nucleotidyltransferase component of viral defense system
MAEEIYRRQVALLLRVLPVIATETCFALKGGTAINLFIRNMPRLSVDIDLAYLPIADRYASLREITAALKRIQKQILASIPGCRVQESTLAGTEHIVKLIVRTAEAQISIEVAPVLRGTVFPVETREVSRRVEAEFGYASMQVVSFADLYAGKIVAALDRQHPRDFFDVRLLLANEGVSRDLFRAFLVYLISHDRPMAEVLAPNRQDIRQEFQRGFIGMTVDPIKVEDLEQTREELIRLVHKSFTENDKNFLLSIKKGNADWKLLGLPGIELLPAVRWKLLNLERTETGKRQRLIDNLTSALYKERQP